MGKSILLIIVGVLGGLGMSASVPRACAQGDQKTPPPGLGQFPDLGKGLMETPGCLGIRGLDSMGGKQHIIFAWFKNKKAVADWYYSKMHQGAMATFFPGVGKNHVPLSLFKDDTAPVMMIASVTVADKPEAGKPPFTQIAIEAYTPVPGGFGVGGTFAPAALKVPGFEDFSSN